MEKALKQRLTGAVIIVIAGVVFIPLLLDGAGHHARFAKEVVIPPEPSIKIKSWDELKEIPAKATNKVLDNNTSEAVPEKATEKTPKEIQAQDTELDKKSASTETPLASPTKKTIQPTIKAWALQLGSFSQQTNALVLRDQLRAKGYRAFVNKTSKKGDTQYKVKIGPDLNRSKIEKIAEKLKKNEKIDSIIITHP